MQNHKRLTSRLEVANYYSKRCDEFLVYVREAVLFFLRRFFVYIYLLVLFLSFALKAFEDGFHLQTFYTLLLL